MQKILAPAIIGLAALAATPASALEFGDAFRVTGDFGVGYDGLLNTGSIGWDTSLGVPLSFGGVDVEVGLRTTGLTKTSGGILFAPPRTGLYASASGQYWGLHVGFVEHATDAYLPNFDLFQSPNANVLGPGQTPPFTPFLRFQEALTVGDTVVRAEAKYQGFLLAYSRSNLTVFSSVYASYDFDVAKVFAGADYASGTLLGSYFGAEGSIDKFDLAVMLMNQPGLQVTNLAATYNFNDKFSAGIVAKAFTGATYWGLNGNYQITDLVKASVGYTNISGTGIASAQITIDLN